MRYPPHVLQAILKNPKLKKRYEKEEKARAEKGGKNGVDKK